MKKLKINFKYFAYFALLIVGIIMPTSIYAATGDNYAHAELINAPSTTSVSFDFQWNSGRYYDYKFTAPSTGSVHVYTTGANTDTDLKIYDDSYNYLTGDTTNNNNVNITFNVTQGSTYILDLYNYKGSNYGNFTLHIEMGTPPPSGTTWVKNAAGDSATTDPSPYTNNADATETLTIAGAAALTVTVSGSLEYKGNCGYDYVTITDSAGTVSQKYCGTINDSFTATGPSVDLVFHSDGGTVDTGATVSIAEGAAPTTTTWVKNAAGDSATTDPSPYIDNSDATETLTIAGATALTVTVTGRLEYKGNCGYDYVTITDSAGTVSQKYCGTINDSFTATGPSVDLVFHSDGGTVATGATVSIAEGAAPTTTTWVKNAAGDSATTDPSPYIDNSDATETLTIAGATALTVTVTGRLEYKGNCGYDYVTITDSANNVSQRYCGTINDSFTATGPSVDLVFHSDGGTVATGATVSIAEIVALAHPDNYSTPLNIPLVVNATDGLLANDEGSGIRITAADVSSLDGTIDPYDAATGSFTFTPDSGFAGTTTFTYTISDNSGHTSTATVTINVENEPSYTTNLGFELINPESTRNVIGNYLQAGNTVLCLVNKSSGYPTSSDVCVDKTSSSYFGGRDSTSNDNVAKYIKIEDNASLWNASSSYITLPDIYKRNGGKGILWAGLIWQGRFSTSSSSAIRYYTEDGSGGIVEHGTRSARSVSLKDTNVKNIRLKVENGSYVQVTANKIYSAGNSNSFSYTAIADVTRIVQDANLAAGKRVFTVANLPTSEGRESNPGIFGGWSLVMIYAENVLNGKPRNISIYGGMERISGDSVDFRINGFKLPSNTDENVTAQLSIFSGEGEFQYGPDGVKIKNASGRWADIPDSTHDVFDGVLTGIERDHIDGKYNDLQKNNTGVDVDLFNITTIMTGFNRNTTSLDMQMWADEYVVPGMIAFSTELYQPKLCYEYTFDIGGYQIPSVNNEVNTSLHLSNSQLTTHVAIRSKEADFPLNDVNFTVVSDPKYMHYQSGSASLAPNAILGYTPSPVFNIDNPLPSSFTMNIGMGAGTGPGQGGVIKGAETTYVRFNHEMNTSKSHIDTTLKMYVEYTVDYGSGPVPQAKLLTETCGGSGSYLPTYGTFNVERTKPTVAAAKDTDFNLYTQVSGREFELNVVAYKADANYTRRSFPNDVVVEVEVVNANILGADADVQCNNPDGYGTTPEFIKIPAGQKSVRITAQKFDIARRNAVYRIWNLKASDGSLLQHDCETEGCFHTLHSTEYSSDGNCTSSCTGGGTGCYECLRKFYGKVTCSRDNFAVRPASYKIALIDSNNDVEIGVNDTETPYKVVAGYDYKYEVNATSFMSDTLAQGYRQGFESSAWSGYDVNEDVDMGAFMLNQARIDNNTKCNDKDHKKFPFSFWDGLAKNEKVPLKNVGQYKLHFLDGEWTAVDYANANPKIGRGCIANSNSIPSVTPSSDKVGCTVNSEYNATRTDLHIYAYPEHFDLKSVQYSTTNPNDLFIYANTLGFGTNNDSNMSINLLGEIKAEGADNTILSNFVTECYAEELKLTLDSNTSPVNPVDVNGLPVEFRWLENSASGGNNTDRFTNQAYVRLVKSQFTKTLGGKTQLKLYVNFERPSDTVMNPFEFKLADLNVTCKNNSCRAYANGDSTFDPKGVQIYDKNVTVLYGRVNAPRRIVMCADGGVGKTCKGEMDFYYEFYADDKANANLIKRLLGTNPQRSANSVNWYKNTVHAASDGEVKLTTQPDITAGTPTTAKGVTKISYTYDGSKGYPFKESLNITSGTGVEPWLIYDKYNAAATQTSADLEFYGPGKWTSTVGSNTTHSTKANKKKKTSRRIQW